ncbi:Gfo/Idh/MocA family protein [Neptunicella marina]|uniref:Gfo/Idh/MocA family oxidoreductase n=1 Tax=Neptunicella marina TaxID=2125989 RepID=A0A8J6IT37_9ALTE|nr:Gfo/Idh/MocA family oxidoreductase [Neptunicella marina]MBC3765108.1 Gfo/Idh/MocA family oxidoreductase [Neptunicella marina]
MRIGIIGLGDIAQKAYLPVLAGREGTELVLCTRDAKCLHRISTRYRIKECYTELSHLLAAGVDAIMIHAATQAHSQMAMQALQAGIPVFVDKPLSYHFEQCEPVFELAAKQNLPFMLGFNRRYAPLYQDAISAPLLSLNYQKNRFNLPDEPRRFIVDDFIHLIDFALFCGKQAPSDVQLMTSIEQKKLATISVNWQQQQAQFRISMNRLNGINQERLEYHSCNQHWQIDNLRQGVHYQQNQQIPLGFDDWQTTLFKRGFVTMINEWVRRIESGDSQSNDIQHLWNVHWLAEQLTQQAEQRCLKS